MTVSLSELVSDIATSIKRIDERRPQAANARTGALYQPGIGPHSETGAVQLIKRELEELRPEKYRAKLTLGVAYPGESRQKCDICLGSPDAWEWALEAKLLRIMGDNGKPNDNMLMHILSPYPVNRSALTDCAKLANSPNALRKAVIIYGFDYSDHPMDPAIDAFEVLARRQVRLGERISAQFADLVHPIHSNGRIFGWEVFEATAETTPL
jgi:hypothetical protein